MKRLQFFSITLRFLFSNHFPRRYSCILYICANFNQKVYAEAGGGFNPRKFCGFELILIVKSGRTTIFKSISIK